MEVSIPREVLEIYKKLEDSNFQVFLVGGGVRNLLMGKDVKDWDLTTSATPEEITALFPDSYYDNKFGTVGVPTKDKNNQTKTIVEITTFRSESEYKDNRHPEKITWGKSIEEDLQRRDFTMNAIAAKFMDNSLEFIDPFNGKKDIEAKLIKAVGDPKVRFKEDALRLMRAVRFACELDFTIEEDTWKELKSDAKLLTNISAERIRDELMKILASDKSYEGILLLKDAGLLQIVLPELLEGVGVSQERPGRHHKDDVFNHNLKSLKFTPATDPIVRLATLIHDVGKPRVEGKDESGLVIFYNHEVEGARIAEKIADNLRLSKKEKQRIVNLIRWHMFTIDENITDAAIRRFIRRVGVENVKDMIDLRIGDRLGGGTQQAESWRLKKFKERLEKELGPKPFSMDDMAVDGKDVMKELNIKPGPKVGEILNKLFDEVDEDMSRNNHEYLLKRIQELK